MSMKKIIKMKSDKMSKKTCEDCGGETKGVLLFKKCPDCKSKRIATLAETGEKFCRACGLVIF
jgi:predicted Zn-ribbon and HTH transcriptional regulator